MNFKLKMRFVIFAHFHPSIPQRGVVAISPSLLLCHLAVFHYVHFCASWITRSLLTAPCTEMGFNVYTAICITFINSREDNENFLEQLDRISFLTRWTRRPVKASTVFSTKIPIKSVVCKIISQSKVSRLLQRYSSISQARLRFFVKDPENDL
jgi:hypothetical protein